MHRKPHGKPDEKTVSILCQGTETILMLMTKKTCCTFNVSLHTENQMKKKVPINVFCL